MKNWTPRCVTVITVVAALVLGACGGSDEEPDTDADRVTTEAPPAPDGTSVDESAEEPSEGEGPEPLPVIGEGSCRVVVTGDKQVEWTGGGTAGDIAASYWFTDEDREFFGDEFILLMNCDGAGGSLSLLTGPNANESNVPLGPGAYTLTSSGASVGDDLFGALVVLTDSETNWSVMEPGGTLEITRFDQSGIAGTFEFPMEDSLASISEGESEGTIVVSGEFDFVNPRG